jgi:hypothetical protein
MMHEAARLSAHSLTHIKIDHYIGDGVLGPETRGFACDMAIKKNPSARSHIYIFAEES